MVNLEEFIQSIHSSTAAAAEALIKKNLGLIDQFFEPVDSQEASEVIARMASAGKSDAKVEAPEDTQRRVRSATGIFAEEAQLDRRPQQPRRKEEDSDDELALLRPKMVALQYPLATPEGPRIQVVHVPLISLVPLSQVQLKELNFSTELDLSVHGDALQVSFPKRQAAAEDSRDNQSPSAPKGTRAQLEVKISAMETPEGLKYVVDGYERALRAQIPG